jgi:hypothetical protein
LEHSQLQELESALAASFKGGCESNESIDDIQLEKKAASTTFPASSSWIDRCKMRHNIVYRVASGESRRGYSETVEDWKYYQLL